MAATVAATQSEEIALLQQIEGCGYEPVERKGGGTYGVVWGVIDVGHGQVAYKYTKPYDYDRYGLDDLNEVDVSTRMDHPYIAHAYKVITRHDCKIHGIALLLPEGDRGTLFNVAQKGPEPLPGIQFTQNKQLRFIQKLEILYRLAAALDFLHQNQILHLDIKLDNVVIKGPNLHPYLIDFGFAMVVDDITTGFYNANKYVTINYRAPEILRGSRRYNGAVDVWSFGILMLYTLTGREYYPRDINEFVKKDNAYGSILLANAAEKLAEPETYDRLLLGIPIEYMAIVRTFLLQVLKIDPKQRLTANQIVNHPIFDTVRFPIVGALNEPILDYPIVYTYSADHQVLIALMIAWGETIYENDRAELLFLAIDLYNRTAFIHANPTKYHQRWALAATCLWVASKLMRGGVYELPKYIPLLNAAVPMIKPLSKLIDRDILDEEINIIHVLGGRLNMSKLYKACKDAKELAISLKYVIGYEMPDHNSALYARTSISGWIEFMRDPNHTWDISSLAYMPPTKDIAIQDLVLLANDVNLRY